MKRLLSYLLFPFLVILGACASNQPHKPVPHPDHRSVAVVSSCTRSVQNSCCRCHDSQATGFEDLQRDASRVERDMDREDFAQWIHRHEAPDLTPAQPPRNPNAKLY